MVEKFIDKKFIEKKFIDEKFTIEKFMVENFKAKEIIVRKFIVEKVGLISPELKILRLKCPDTFQKGRKLFPSHPIPGLNRQLGNKRLSPERRPNKWMKQILLFPFPVPIG